MFSYQPSAISLKLTPNQQFKGGFYSFTIASFLALLLNHPIRFLENKLELSKIYAILLVFLTFTLIFSVRGND